MNRKEREQAKVFDQVCTGIITQAAAARRLGISDRWVRKKLIRYKKGGDQGLIHCSRGKRSPLRWDSAPRDLLLELASTEWHGFGPTFLSEKLFEYHTIKVSKETIRKELIKANLWHGKKRRVKHRARRERRAQLGCVVQLDGSPHDWFEGRGQYCTLLVFIDDAQSKILWLEFVPSESWVSVSQATKNYIEKHGIPQSFYLDFGSVFHVNLNNPDNLKKTQWEQSAAQLGIKVIHAHSPQAKGRVERCNKTLQDRLVKEMRLAGISSIEQANQFLKTSSFIEKHNQKFAVKAVKIGDFHRSPETYDLTGIFSSKEQRVLANDFTLSFKKQLFQLDKQQRTILRPKDIITVKTSLDGIITLSIRKTQLFYSLISNRSENIITEKKACSRVYKPTYNSRLWAAGKIISNRPESRVESVSPTAEATVLK